MGSGFSQNPFEGAERVRMLTQVRAALGGFRSQKSLFSLLSKLSFGQRRAGTLSPILSPFLGYGWPGAGPCLVQTDCSSRLLKARVPCSPRHLSCSVPYMTILNSVSLDSAWEPINRNVLITDLNINVFPQAKYLHFNYRYHVNLKELLSFGILNNMHSLVQRCLGMLGCFWPTKSYQTKGKKVHQWALFFNTSMCIEDLPNWLKISLLQPQEKEIWKFNQKSI